MEDWLKDDERLDYLLAEDLRIIQSPSVFSFSLDAVLLSRFVQVPKSKGHIVDLCSGFLVGAKPSYTYMAIHAF